MSKKILLVAGLLCAIAGGTSAQEVAMGVDDILHRIAEHNADVRSARSHYEAVSQGVGVAKSALLPEVSASLDLNYIGDGTILDRDFTNAMRDKLPHFGNTLSVNLFQPIYTGGAITAGIDMANQKAELAAIGIEQQTDASGIEAVATFLNLSKMHNLRKVYEANIEVMNRLIAQMAERQRQGTALKNDLTRYELRLSSLRLELRSVENNISVLNNNLVKLLGLEANAEIKPIGSEAVPAMETEDYWQNATMTHSTDLRAVGQSRSMAETSLRLNKAERMPTVGIVVGDHLAGPVTFEIPAINKNYNAWFAGVTIGYKLSSLWTTAKKERQTRSEIIHIDDQRTALSNALSRRVHEAYVALQQAGEQIETEQVNVRLGQNDAAIDIAQAALHMAELNLSYTVITAPCDGYCSRKSIHVGQLVQPGQTLVEVVDAGNVWVVANYKERQTSGMKIGDKVEISVDAVPGVTFHGEISDISAATGEAYSARPHANAVGNFVKVEQRIPVKIRLTKANAKENLDRLRAGMNVECKLKD